MGQRLKPSLPREIRCGASTDPIKGIRRTQDFRPTYFTAAWTDGVLVQVRLWGPRIFDDGSVGDRDLDYRWKKTAATGPVRYPDLPAPLRRRLMDYDEEMASPLSPNSFRRCTNARLSRGGLRLGATRALPQRTVNLGPTRGGHAKVTVALANRRAAGNS